MNSGRFCESEFWTAKVAMNRMSKGNTFYGRKAHITSFVEEKNTPSPVCVASRYFNTNQCAFFQRDGDD